MNGRFGVNYWKLWSASVISNFGDGVAQVAYPWLASLVTRDGFKLGLVVLAGRLPWLLFSLPAGVITDRVDRKRLMVWMDAFRSALTAGVVWLVFANVDALSVAQEGGATPANDGVLLVALVLATFLFGVAEVLRDNTAQTMMPSVVDRSVLEKANGRLWAAEVVMNQSVGPPLGGVFIGLALALPFLVHSGTFAISAVVLATMAGTFRPAKAKARGTTTFRGDMAEGFRMLWSHSVLRPLAITLGVFNATAMMSNTTFVLFAQELLGLDAAGFGLLLTSGAVGGVLGALAASRVAGRLSRGTALFVSMSVFGGTQAIIGLFPSAILAWSMMALATFFVMVWNVITVSLRQRIVADEFLGRVNSVYRFFGWGMMSIGALAGGALVSLSGPMVGRDWSLRLPFLVTAGIQILMLVYSIPRFNTRRIEEAEALAPGDGPPA